MPALDQDQDNSSIMNGNATPSDVNVAAVIWKKMRLTNENFHQPTRPIRESSGLVTLGFGCGTGVFHWEENAIHHGGITGYMLMSPNPSLNIAAPSHLRQSRHCGPQPHGQTHGLLRQSMPAYLEVIGLAMGVGLARCAATIRSRRSYA